MGEGDSLYLRPSENTSDYCECGENSMIERALLFVRDVELFETIRRTLLDHHPIEVEFAGTAKAAIQRLSSQRVPTLFLDYRLEHFDDEVTQLLDAIKQNFSAINLVSVGDGNYPLPIAEHLDLLTLEHVIVSSKGTLQIPEDGLQRVLSAARARPIPQRREISADGITLSTYTEELFPVLDDLKRVAHRDVTLLLVGETGTGKTTLARLIHNQSSRRDKPFQHLACGALPADLIESELFGHVRGAFTGAERNKIGRFQAAGRGTLLLDEIDVLELKQQAKLLKVIETGEFEMVGSTEPRQSEARLIVASNVNLEELAAAGRFRSDLYYRLNVLEFRLLPLRERLQDITHISIGIIGECCRTHDIQLNSIDFRFLDALKRYRWPGNLRELKNHLCRAVLFSEDNRLMLKDIAPKVVQADFADEPPSSSEVSRRGWTLAERVAQSERESLYQALRENGHNRTKTAKALGLSRVGLYKKLKRLGLMDNDRELSRSEFK
jgi:DNA-binding NtrC family response regulator